MKLGQNNFILECWSINLYFFFLEYFNKFGTQVQSVPSEEWWSRLTRFFKMSFGCFLRFINQSQTLTLFHSPSNAKSSSKIIMAITNSLRGRYVFKGEARSPRRPLHLSRFVVDRLMSDALFVVAVVFCLSSFGSTSAGFCSSRNIKISWWKRVIFVIQNKPRSMNKDRSTFLQFCVSLVPVGSHKPIYGHLGGF